MPRYTAFLRAVNLGSTRKTPSGELRAAFAAVGFVDVATFRTSGNVVFSVAGRTAESRLVRDVEAGLGKAFGFEITVFLRSAVQLRAIAAREPFTERERNGAGGKLQVDLLSKQPTAKAKRAVLAMATAEDRLAIHGRELFWLPQGGTLDSSLDLKAIERLIGPTTMRTMGTVEAIVAKFFA